MDSRKIQLVGNRSYAVSLPKEWVINNRLKNKDTVFIETTGNNELLIKNTAAVKKDDKIITVNLEDVDNITEFIVFCYVKNIDKIRIIIKKSDYEKVIAIRSLLKYLEGYDITKEDEKIIEIAFLFHDINININNIMRRMIYLLKLMMASIINKDSKNLQDTETNIDKLYHLSKRIIFSCISSQKQREENDINNQEDLFFIKDIVKKIESMGDSIYNLRSQAITPKEIETINEIISILEMMLDKKPKMKEIKNRLHNINITSKNKEVAYRINRIQELCKDAMENFMSIQFNTEYFKE
jgi:phosphate uptake regulator